MSDDKYLAMQSRQYEREAATWNLDHKDPVVGAWDKHEASSLYDTVLWEGIPITGEEEVLDYGCGPGRCLVRFADKFARLDGVDIAQENLNKAKEYILDSGLDDDDFFLNKNDGNNIPMADDIYDIVYSVICMQHIAVHDIRMAIMKEVFRVLKPGGWYTFQMGYGNRPEAVLYHENKYDAPGTNGTRDVQVHSPEFLVEDLQEIGFVNMNWQLTDVISDRHDQWIWMKAQKPE